jgi:FtsP/CotA-like multicopper oxidase with cupredoxin domain
MALIRASARTRTRKLTLVLTTTSPCLRHPCRTRRRHVTANGTIPGPPIVVNEGDWLEVTVLNRLPSEPTTLHWHGQLQVMTPFSDGVPSMTQCAIMPGDSLTYSFRASNAGTFWYHGHMLEQYTEGLFGLLQVLPAPGSEEDLTRGLDLGAADNEVFVMLSDYYNNNAHELLTLFYMTPESEGVEPIPDAIMANGKHKGSLFMSANRAGKTLVHVICAASFSMFTVSVDGVNLQLVEVDSTAIAPITVPSISINVAQRMSFVVDWSTLDLPSTAKGVYFRARAMTEMYALDPAGYVPPYESALLRNPPQPLDPAYTAVFQFSPLASGSQLPDYAADGTHGTAPVRRAIPVPASGPYAGLDASAGLDSNYLDALPLVPLHMPTGTHQLYLEVLFYVDEASGVNVGHLNGISHVHNMVGGMMPALYDKSVYGTPLGSASAHSAADFHNAAFKPFGYADSGPMPALPIAYTDEAHYLLPPGAVVVMLINNTDSGEHPFHFHGHTVWVVASSEHPDGAAARAAANSVMRRDTVSIPGLGWAKVAFIAENPGTYDIPLRL